MPLTIDDLLKQDSDETEFTFDAAGLTLKARVLRDASDVMRLQRKVDATKRMIARGNAHPDWAEYVKGIDEGVLRTAVFCEALMIDPPLSMRDCLKLAKANGVLFLQIGDEVLGRSVGTVVDEETDAIDEAKNE